MTIIISVTYLYKEIREKRLMQQTKLEKEKEQEIQNLESIE